MTLRTAAAAIAIVCSIAVAGCGLGPGPGTSKGSVTGTRGFGTHQVAVIEKSRVPGSETVMRMLERSFPITTRYGGGFVQSIDGLGPSSPQTDWFYYVNGVL